MTNRQIKTTLDIIMAVSMTIGGASSIPGLGLPPQVLAWGLLIAAVCKAVSGQLSQVTGESDETQNIAPAQVAASQAAHDAAKTAPATAPAAAPGAAGKVGLVLLCAALALGATGCVDVPSGASSANSHLWIGITTNGVGYRDYVVSMVNTTNITVTASTTNFLITQAPVTNSSGARFTLPINIGGAIQQLFMSGF